MKSDRLLPAPAACKEQRNLLFFPFLFVAFLAAGNAAASGQAARNLLLLFPLVNPVHCFFPSQSVPDYLFCLLLILAECMMCANSWR
jgi:hypothetical protein